MLNRINLETMINDASIGKVTNCYISHVPSIKNTGEGQEEDGRESHLLIEINLNGRQAVSVWCDFSDGVSLSDPIIKYRNRSIRDEYLINPHCKTKTATKAEDKDFEWHSAKQLMAQIAAYEDLMKYVVDWLDCDAAVGNKVEWNDIDFNRPLGESHNSKLDPKKISKPYAKYVDKAILSLLDADKQISLISGAMQHIEAADGDFKLMYEYSPYGDRYSLFDGNERINVFLMDEYLAKNAGTSVKNRSGK